MLNNKDIEICAVMGIRLVVVKTYLSLRMALNCLKKAESSTMEILGVREPTGEGERIGYLKGDFDDKDITNFSSH